MMMMMMMMMMKYLEFKLPNDRFTNYPHFLIVRFVSSIEDLTSGTIF